MVGVAFVLLTNLAARAAPRKMSGWDFPRRQTETGKTPILLTTTRYSQLINLFFLVCGSLFLSFLLSSMTDPFSIER